jgi:hypothetical protein
MPIALLNWRAYNSYRMKTKDAIAYFGSQTALAAKLDISQPTISCWKERPPLEQQAKIEVATGGKLRAELPEWMQALLKFRKAGGRA